MEKRPAEENDQEQIQKGFEILIKAMQEHPEIESSLWAGAMWSSIINGYINSGMSHELFSQECEKIREHYKEWFEEKDKNEST